MAKFRIAVLASGSGTNLQALIDQVHKPGIASIVYVASDKTKAGALERAKAAGIKAEAIPPLPGENRHAYQQRLAAKLGSNKPDLLVLAGFMRLLTAQIIQDHSPILNVHPSLLPAFPGLDSPGQALEYGAKVTGCTVHLVDEGMDTGPIVLQQAVPVQSGDTPETLHRRIQVLEHRLLVRAVIAFARGQVIIRGRHISIEEEL